MSIYMHYFAIFVVSYYGKIYLTIFNLVMLTIYVMIVKRCQIDEKWKAFLLLNPILPYVATSYLRDIVIYILIVSILTSVRLFSLQNVMSTILLGVLRPAAAAFTAVLSLHTAKNYSP